jgi:phytoene dehydrogenase-like protein
VNHVRGGIGAIAQTLVSWIRAQGGEVQFRQEVEAIEVENGRAIAVHTNKGRRFGGDWFVANLTPWALRDLLGDAAPRSLRQETRERAATWGAFTLYLGVDAAALPAGIPTHHQVIQDPSRPLGEGNSVFISLADEGDGERAPAGQRPVTLSTHTEVARWWQLRGAVDEEAYLARRQAYTERLLAAAEQAIPGMKQAAQLVLPGTPVTFQFYTRRPLGMVGGFPQRSLFDVRGPQTGLGNVRLVGDSIFPGQSTAGVTLGGMRVAADIVRASRPGLFSLPAWSGADARAVPDGG